MRRRGGWRGALGVVAGVLVLGAAACGSDDSGTATTGQAPAGSTAPSTTVAVARTTPGGDQATGGGAVVPDGGYELTATAYGPLHLGMTVAEATATGLVDAFGPGCELASPPEVGAPLTGDLDGSVTASGGVVTAIVVRSRATTSPGGVQVGDPLAQVEAAFGDGYVVQVDKAAEEVFGEWFVHVTRGGEPQLELSVDPSTQAVDGIGIPTIPVCE